MKKRQQLELNKGTYCHGKQAFWNVMRPLFPVDKEWA